MWGWATNLLVDVDGLAVPAETGAARDPGALVRVLELDIVRVTQSDGVLWEGSGGEAGPAPVLQSGSIATQKQDW